MGIVCGAPEVKLSVPLLASRADAPLSRASLTGGYLGYYCAGELRLRKLATSNEQVEEWLFYKL